MSERDKRIPIELKTITTPKGEVPTVESFQSLLNGLNILDSELEYFKQEYAKLLNEIKQDFKSMKKLLVDNTISIDSFNERLGLISKTLSERISNESQLIKEFREDVSKTLNDLLNAQRNFEESFIKSMESISKILGLKLTTRGENKPIKV